MAKVGSRESNYYVLSPLHHAAPAQLAGATLLYTANACTVLLDMVGLLLVVASQFLFSASRLVAFVLLILFREWRGDLRHRATSTELTSLTLAAAVSGVWPF